MRRSDIWVSLCERPPGRRTRGDGQAMVKTDFDVRYDRRVSPQFLEHLAPDGVAASLAKYAKSALFPLDLRLRSDVKSGVDHASLYVGLTAVLKIQSSKAGLLKLSVNR